MEYSWEAYYFMGLEEVSTVSVEGKTQEEDPIVFWTGQVEPSEPSGIKGE